MMKNIFSPPVNNKKGYLSEITATEIIDGHSLHQLPRHIPRWETRSHRGMANFAKHHYIPKPEVCAVDACKPQQNNVAFDILKYQLCDRSAIKKHRCNLLANLKHRLDKAQARGDSQLVNILQDEYRQLDTSC